MRQHRVFRIKIHFSCRRPGRCRKSLSDYFAPLQRIHVKIRMKQLIQRFCFNPAYRFFRRNHTFIHQVAGDLNCRPCGTLAVTCLEEEQLAVFNGKFHILHIFIVRFQFVSDLHELPIAFRQIFLQFGNRLRRTDSCHNVFTLRIDQIFPINPLRARGRISRESNARSGSISHISEYHRLHVYRRSPVAGNIIHPAVYDRPVIIPGTEHRFYRFHQLHPRFLREIAAHFIFIDLFESLNHFLQIFCCQLCIKVNSLAFLDLVQNPFKI